MRWQAVSSLPGAQLDVELGSPARGAIDARRSPHTPERFRSLRRTPLCEIARSTDIRAACAPGGIEDGGRLEARRGRRRGRACAAYRADPPIHPSGTARCAAAPVVEIAPSTDTAGLPGAHRGRVRVPGGANRTMRRFVWRPGVPWGAVRSPGRAVGPSGCVRPAGRRAGGFAGSGSCGAWCDPWLAASNDAEQLGGHREDERGKEAEDPSQFGTQGADLPVEVGLRLPA